jgi:D-alanine-D-alanine ligase
MLEMLGIPYVGSGPEGHALALDKVITKVVMQKNDISTPNFWVFSTGDEDMGSVEYPVIVKPKMEAVSYGLKIVNNEADLREAVKFVINEFQQQALVEQFIRGREFCVGLLGNGDPEAFPVLEIDLEGDPDGIQTVDDKKKQPRKKICPANLSAEQADEMVKLSKEAFRSLGLRDFARVDIRMDENEKIYLLEINSMASLGQTGSYVNAAAVAGYDFSKLINKMLDVAAVRYFSERLVVPDDLDLMDKAKLPLHVRLRMFLRSKQQNHERLLSKITNINTYVRNVEGVNTVGQIIWKELSSLNFVHQSIPQVEIGNIILLSNTEDNNYDVLLMTNLDNSVPFKKHAYFRETEHKFSGSGIWSSKGGLVIMIAALRALRFARILRKMKVGILLTTDDTLQGRITRSQVEEISKRARVVLGLSGGSLEGSLVTSRSGAAVYECQMNLVKANDAIDVAKANASFTRLLANIAKLSDETEKVIINPRDVRITSDIASLSAHGEASLSMRFNSSEQAEAYEDKINQLVKKSNKDNIQIQISGALRRSPMIKTPEIENLYQKVRSNAHKIDIRILEEHRWSSSNICFVDVNKPKIDGLGPVGAKKTEENEFILRHSILDRALLLSLLLNELFKKEMKK